MMLAANDPDIIGIGNAAVGRHIVMLVVSDLRIDPRVEREARSLAAVGYIVSVICPEPVAGAAATVRLDWGPNVSISWLRRSGATFVNYRPGYLADALYREAVKSRPFAFHAHDLNTAFAALAAARWTGAHLVVDFHEWFSENVHWNHATSQWVPYGSGWKVDLQVLEARCLSEASRTLTVCDSIADAMSDELGGHRPAVVRNIPSLSAVQSRPYPSLKDELGLPPSCFLLLWQGGTGPTRLIEPIIEALAHAPQCVFVIRGPSLDLYGPSYIELARKMGVERRLVLLPPVPSGDVVAAARSADAGIWTLPALCRNFTLALPNKLFEYLAAGLPILAADYPEARRLVSGNRVGLMFDPYNVQSIAAAINSMIAEPTLISDFRKNTKIALETLDAQQEWRKVVSLYDGLSQSRLRESSPSPSSAEYTGNAG
jgi:glycosyltransferase involved in cell wall biosynthesis